MTRKNGKGGAVAAAAKRPAKAKSSLAGLIDPLLKAGDMTVKEIATEVGKKAGEAAKGKDLEANVRARMVAHTRNGWEVRKDDQRRIKIVQKA